MTLLHLFLIHRYKATAIHYLSPTDDNRAQASSLERLGIFSSVNDEVGEIIVAEIDLDRIRELVEADGSALTALITKS